MITTKILLPIASVKIKNSARENIVDEKGNSSPVSHPCLSSRGANRVGKSVYARTTSLGQRETTL